MTNDKSSEERLKKFISEANLTPYTDAEGLAEAAWYEQEAYWRKRVKEKDEEISTLIEKLHNVTADRDYLVDKYKSLKSTN